MSGRVLGTGIDLVECARIAQSLEKFGDRFLNRVFLPSEIEYARSQKHTARHLAARFAAKEAVSKAFGTGIGAQVGWKDMEVRRRESGAPYLALHGAGLEFLQAHGGGEVLISLTHTDTMAAASAVWVGA
jgi:holo-[acyl-carrier protein] synthase